MSAIPAPLERKAGLLQGIVPPTLLTWATRGLAFEIRGRGNGIWQGTFAVGQFLSGIIVTFLGETSGGLLPAFIHSRREQSRRCRPLLRRPGP